MAWDVRRVARVVALAVSALALVGCHSPSRPSTSVVAGRPASPPSDASLSFYSQPVTLRLDTGVATNGASLTTIVEVATDVDFASIVTTQTVVPGASRQVTVTLDHLAASTTYYWRVRSNADDNTVVSATASFRMGPEVVIQPPSPVQPQAASFTHKRPTLAVVNATHTGPATTLRYRFDIATDPAFTNVAAGATLPESAAQTSFTPDRDLRSGVTYYWRAQVSDVSTGVASAYSTTQAFTTVFPDDGTYRYDLALQFTPPCLGGSGSGPSVPGFTFDDGLVVRGDSLRFTLPPDLAYDPYNVPRFELDIQRSGTQLSGNIGGRTLLPDIRNTWLALSLWRRYDNSNPSWRPAPFVGTTDNRGRLTGTFDGFALGEMLVGRVLDCEFRGATWTLTPH